MAAPTDNFHGPLKYQTWTLRVPIHCEGCKKKVRKILHKIDGVYITTIDAHLHKVTVTGNIDAQTLLHRLSKAGKPAELWADNTSLKKENLLEAPTNEKPIKVSDEKFNNNNNKKSPKENTGKATEEGSQKKDKKSADNHSNPPKTLNEGEEATPNPIDGDKPLLLENEGGDGNPQNNNGSSSSNKKKKNKSKGNNENSPNDGNPISPSPASIPSQAPAPAEMLAPAPKLTSVPADIPAPSSVPAETLAPVSARTPASVPAHAPAPASVPAHAPVEGYSGPSMHHNRPIQPVNSGGSLNNFGPPPQGYPHGPYLGPADNFGPMNQHDYMHPAVHHPPPQPGISYNMAQPSISNSSYYVPPYYAYQYPRYPMMHGPPPPPSNPINEYNDDDHYYDDNASQCRLM